MNTEESLKELQDQLTEIQKWRMLYPYRESLIAEEKLLKARERELIKQRNAEINAIAEFLQKKWETDNLLVATVAESLELIVKAAQIRKPGDLVKMNLEVLVAQLQQ